MAKAKPLTELDPHAPTGQNARSIARTRLDEMYHWAAGVDDPYAVRGLHNLRIAAKRLRYTLEIFADVLPAACQSIADELTQIQDDRDLWHKLGKQAHIHVKNNYLLPTMVSQYLNALKRALERRAGEA